MCFFHSLIIVISNTSASVNHKTELVSSKKQKRPDLIKLIESLKK